TFDHFAARAQATEALPFSIGLEKGTTKPFSLATNGRGSLTSRIPGADCPGMEKTVGVDIFPRNTFNPMNPKSRGSIPVAILSSAGFNAPGEIVTDSLTFGRTGDELSLSFCAERGLDVNSDGLL